MPVSRNGKLYYTEEQAKRASERNNALDYARSHGYDLISKGKDFTMREHTSMVFTEDGWWHWNGRNLHGRALEFIMFYEDGLMEKHPEYLKKAIIKLAGENVQANAPRPEKAAVPEPQSPPKPFVLPEPNSDHKRAFAYLTKTRGIDPDIVSHLMKEKKIFESKDRHNAVFVFQDNSGETKGAFLRGTSKDPKYQFKGMAAGSDRADSYFLFGGSKTASVACVFEASIDALSYATLQKLSGNSDLTQRYYIATGGAGDNNFLSFLKGHPEVKNVILCQDNDAAGNKFAKDLGDKLRGMGYQVSRCLSKGKDFNEELQKEKTLEQPAQQEKDSSEHYKSFVGRVLSNPAAELHILGYNQENGTFIVRHVCEPVENTDDTYNEIYTPQKLAEVYDFSESLKEQFFDVNYINTDKTSSIVANMQEASPTPRRYAPDGSPLIYGKSPEHFTENDVRRYLGDMESPQEEPGLYEAMSREQEYMQRNLLSEDEFSVLGD